MITTIVWLGAPGDPSVGISPIVTEIDLQIRIDDQKMLEYIAKNLEQLFCEIWDDDVESSIYTE